MAAGLRKVVDERFHLSKASGGMLRREIWVDGRGRVVRYNLAYINARIHAGDNGRVLGYDSAHGRLHRHFKDRVTEVSPGSFEQVEKRFQREWLRLEREVRGEKD